MRFQLESRSHIESNVMTSPQTTINVTTLSGYDKKKEIKRPKLFIPLFVLLFVLLLGMTCWVSILIFTPTPDKSCDHVEYVAIVDAGSTGSRIIVFRFDARNKTSNELRLLSGDFFYESNPGLSSYLDKPDEGVQSIENLLNAARTFIPKDRLSSTRLALRATAGMRFADKAKAAQLINQLNDWFKKSGFKVDEEPVQIMEGSQEGIFSWITVNYLMSPKQSEQLAAMDLGGGSVQITLPTSDAEKASYNNTNLHDLTVDKKKISVFTQSYPGGLEAALYAVLTNGNTTETTLQSSCVHPGIVNASWTYQNVEYHVSGKQNEQNKTDVESCAKLIKENVIPKINPKPVTLKQHQLAAWNKLFSITVGLGGLGNFSVASLNEEAKKKCAVKTEAGSFQCFKLIYTWTLLTDGFGLPKESKLQYTQRISGHYVSWTLGCALHLIDYAKLN